jgi:hypothetical protein
VINGGVWAGVIVPSAHAGESHKLSRIHLAKHCSAMSWSNFARLATFVLLEWWLEAVAIASAARDDFMTTFP